MVTSPSSWNVLWHIGLEHMQVTSTTPVCGVLRGYLNAASAVNLHQPKSSGLLLVCGQRCHCDVSSCGAMGVDKVLVVHSVQVVSCRPMSPSQLVDILTIA